MQFLAGFVKELLDKAKGFDPQASVLIASGLSKEVEVVC